MKAYIRNFSSETLHQGFEQVFEQISTIHNLEKGSPVFRPYPRRQASLLTAQYFSTDVQEIEGRVVIAVCPGIHRMSIRKWASYIKVNLERQLWGFFFFFLKGSGASDQDDAYELGQPSTSHCTPLCLGDVEFQCF